MSVRKTNFNTNEQRKSRWWRLGEMARSNSHRDDNACRPLA